VGGLSTKEVVLVPFPFSDLTGAKRRPAVVLADVGRGDWILCQITSSPYGDRRAIQIVDRDFAHGSLRVASFVRPGKLFTANTGLVVYRAGLLTTERFTHIVDVVIETIRPRSDVGY
jgi:mRNA interferase MazF